jgi:dTDP-4-amino-4,6-dideoxygalactose transaminase
LPVKSCSTALFYDPDRPVFDEAWINPLLVRSPKGRPEVEYMFAERPRSLKAELAILGGLPAFDEPRYVGRPNLGSRDRFMDRMNALLDRRWLTNNGPLVQEFEARIASVLGVRNCVAVCNATLGLELLVGALGLKGSVIVPSFTFIASAHVLLSQGIEPIFCDVDPQTHLIDPEQVEASIRADTTGILGVHLWGRACNVDVLQEIAERRGLALLFDAAHAFGCSRGSRMIGGFGAGEVFSFHATKAINSFEGGAITTNDDALAAKLRLMINFGFSEHGHVIRHGTNGKMNEPCAAMGLTSLEAMDEIFDCNHRNHERYARGLCGVPGVALVDYGTTDMSNYHYVVLEIDEAQFGLTRDELFTVLAAENVQARRYFHPGCHRSEPYRSLPAYSHLSLPVTERLSDTVICLPTGTNMDFHAIDEVCRVITLASKAPHELLSRLRG